VSNDGAGDPKRRGLRAEYNDNNLAAMVATTHHGMLLDHYTVTLLDLPTELLIRILSYLPAVDLCAVQRTCRRIHGIVADSTYLQYILLAQINGVDDILPPDCPFSERIKLLRNHEKSWNNLQLNVSHEFSSTMDRLYYLQDGYLVYNLKHIASTPQYGYVDLRSADPSEELRWVHISVEHISIPVWIESAVDHNLVVVLRYRILSETFLSAKSHEFQFQDSANQVRHAC
jgi:hypothetical protein